MSDAESLMFTFLSFADHGDHIMLLFKHGKTALHHACKSNGPAELVKLLIEQGCDVMAKDNVSNDVMCAYMSYMISMMRSYVRMIYKLI